MTEFPELYTEETMAEIAETVRSLDRMGFHIWTGGLTPEGLATQCKLGDDLAVHLYRRVEQSAAFAAYEQWGREEAALISARAWDLPRPYLSLAFPDRQTPLAARHQHLAIRGVLQELFSVRNLVIGSDGRPTPTGSDATAAALIEDRKEIWLGVARSFLPSLGVAEDEWHQYCLLAFLLWPTFAREVLVLPLWLNPPVNGAPPVTRQAATALGAVDPTERAAVRLKTSWQRDLGFEPPRRTPGQRAGSRKRPDPARLRFDRYVVERRSRGLSPQTIADDAEAARLYREARKDRNATPNERLVQAAVRRNRRIQGE